tara:strand:+ start:332 stop:1075 length:744 start_codon:yes stop_codon:yes gene_type:complete
MNNNFISKKAKIGKNFKVGNFVTITDDVEIGDNCEIESYSYIGYSNGREKRKLIIGNHAKIRSHSIVYLGSIIGENLVTGHHVTIRENSLIGKDFQLGSQSIVMGELNIGDYVKTGSNVEIGQYSKVGNYVWIFLNTTLINDKYPPSEEIIGPTLGDYSVIGAHSVIYPGIKVGKDSLVGSGCFLSKDLSECRIAVGNPSKEIGHVSKIKIGNSDSGAYPWRYRFHKGYPENVVKGWLSELDKIKNI